MWVMHLKVIMLYTEIVQHHWVLLQASGHVLHPTVFIVVEGTVRVQISDSSLLLAYITLGAGNLRFYRLFYCPFYR